MVERSGRQKQYGDRGFKACGRDRCSDTFLDNVDTSCLLCLRHYNVTNIFRWSTLIITLTHNVQFSRQKMKVLDRFTSNISVFWGVKLSFWKCPVDHDKKYVFTTKSNTTTVSLSNNNCITVMYLLLQNMLFLKPKVFYGSLLLKKKMIL